MKKIFFILLIISSSINLYSQSGWFQVNNPISKLRLLNIQFTSISTGYAVGNYAPSGGGEILKTTNAGVNWQRIIFDSTYFIYDICFINDNTGYLETYVNSSFNAYKTTNGGINWNLQLSSPGNGNFKMKFFDVNTGFAAGKGNFVYRTTNGGINWISKTAILLFDPTGIHFFDNKNLVIYNGRCLNTTTNCGDQWTLYTFYYTIGLTLYSVHFFNNTTALNLSYGGEIFKTTNSGVNWFSIGCLPSNLYSLVFLNTNTGYACGGAYNGSIYKTTNGGYNWISQPVPISTGFSAITFVNNLTGYVTEDFGSRILKTTNGGAGLIKNISGESASLCQNYPNPFNPVTSIKYSVMSNQNVKLIVYDNLGREIETLVNEKQSPGTYEVKFDGSNITSGIYYYTLTAGEFKGTKKLILLK